jgi:large subunit ribosomal protein L14e
MALEIGRVCMKVAGREAGKYCVVLKKVDDTFVLVTGPKELTGVKRRRCNIEHLEPTSYLVKIQAEASEKDVIDAYDKIGLTKKFELRLPSPEILKEAEKKIVKVPTKVEVPKEEKKVEKEVKKEEKPEKKEEVKPEEKPKEEKKGITLRLKLPSLRRGKKEEKEVEKVEKRKEAKKEKKKPEKKVGKKK